jgi:hypothetical protein
MKQHQLMLRATWSRIPQHSKTTYATFKNNICNMEILFYKHCNIEICFCNNQMKHLLLLAISAAQSSFAGRRASPWLDRLPSQDEAAGEPWTRPSAPRLMRLPTRGGGGAT